MSLRSQRIGSPCRSSLLTALAPLRRMLLTLALVLAPSQPGLAEPALLTLPDNPLQGRLLFEQKGCVQCHAAGPSRSEPGPDLGSGGFQGSFLDLGAALWNHVPGMSASLADADVTWPRLSGRETTELLSFISFIDYLGRPGEAARGRELFRSQGCSSCHQIEGASSKEGPDLATLERFASPLYVAQAIWNHGPAMLDRIRLRGMAPPRFAEGDLADLAAYIRQKGQQGRQERVLLSPGNPNRGQELFTSRGCSRCHGEAGQGGSDGPNLQEADLHRSAEGIAATMWNHGLAMRQAMAARGVGWPELTTAELADLVSFLYFLPFRDPAGDPERGEEIFSSRSCVDCHGGGEGVGPVLEGGEASGTPAALVAAMWNHAPRMKDEILGAGLPWPDLTGEDLAALLAYLERSE